MNAICPKVAPMSWAQIDQKANQVLARYPNLLSQSGQLNVLRLFDLAEEFGLDPGVGPLPAGVEGMTFPDGRVCVSEAVYIGAKRGEPRPRFTICHEFGHGILHAHQLKAALLDDTSGFTLYRKSSLRAFEDPECQANRFAASILVPLEAAIRLKNRWGTGVGFLGRMESTFGISRETATIYLNRLK